VAIYGGFNGTENLRGQREPAVNITTLSGGIGAAGITDNSHHVLTGGSSTNWTAVLDGFTVTAGFADEGVYPGDTGGGGMLYNDLSSPSLTNITFSANSTWIHGYLLTRL
jgi:hypothetical protein